MRWLPLALALACANTIDLRRPDGGWCYWAADLIKSEAQCECIYKCDGCCDVRGECWPLAADRMTCPAGSVAGLVRL